jgi:hypothetical protein
MDHAHRSTGPVHRCVVQDHPRLPRQGAARRTRPGRLRLPAVHRPTCHRPDQDSYPAEAGVPLARIRDLQAASDDQVRHAIGEVDAELAARIQRREDTRQRLRRLAAEVTDHLDRLTDLGFTHRWVTLETDLWILVFATYPDTATDLFREPGPGADRPGAAPDLHRLRPRQRPGSTRSPDRRTRPAHRHRNPKPRRHHTPTRTTRRFRASQPDPDRRQRLVPGLDPARHADPHATGRPRPRRRRRQRQPITRIRGAWGCLAPRRLPPGRREHERPEGDGALPGSLATRPARVGNGSPCRVR